MKTEISNGLNANFELLRNGLSDEGNLLSTDELFSIFGGDSCTGGYCESQYCPKKYCKDKYEDNDDKGSGSDGGSGNDGGSGGQNNGKG